MPRSTFSRLFAFTGALLAYAAAAAFAAIPASEESREGSAALRAQFEAMRPDMRTNGFGRPLNLVSHDGDHLLKGDVYALVAHPFGDVAQALHEPDQWCQVLVLPFNVKRCEAQDGAALSMFIARKTESTSDQTFRLDFRFAVESLGDDFMRIGLRAESGPLGTRDYHIALEATPADPGHTIIHLSYAYGYGMMSQLAMQAYLSTVGAHKVGFSVDGRDTEGRPIFVRGMRGVMERNTMRYFLAIEAYLDSLAVAPSQREDARLAEWFDASERYPRQLHEMEREEYVTMKHHELARSHACCRVAEGS
jgi:hypothetical protein